MLELPKRIFYEGKVRSRNQKDKIIMKSLPLGRQLIPARKFKVYNPHICTAPCPAPPRPFQRYIRQFKTSQLRSEKSVLGSLNWLRSQPNALAVPLVWLRTLWNRNEAGSRHDRLMRTGREIRAVFRTISAD
jgi:hypothetical protein